MRDRNRKIAQRAKNKAGIHALATSGYLLILLGTGTTIMILMLFTHFLAQ